MKTTKKQKQEPVQEPPQFRLATVAPCCGLDIELTGEAGRGIFAGRVKQKCPECGTEFWFSYRVLFDPV